MEHKGGYILIQYFQPIKVGGVIISIDDIVIDYYISGLGQRDSFMVLLQDISIVNRCELKHWESFKIGAFRNQFTIAFHDKTSFWIGVGLNLAKTNHGRIRLDFNPNKVAIHNSFREILAFLNLNSRAMHTKIPRFDLAVDLPVDRENVFLIKDKRLYSERRHGQEYTQYLGRKSNPGHVKLYNKQAESKLTYPLTRLELTISPDDKYGEINWPMVYYIKQTQISFEDMRLSDTDRFILNALLQGCGTLAQLNRKTRAKMETYMDSYVKRVCIDLKQYEAIRYQLTKYKRYPHSQLDDTDLNPDKNIIIHKDTSDRFSVLNNTAGLPFNDLD